MIKDAQVTNDSIFTNSSQTLFHLNPSLNP